MTDLTKLPPGKHADTPQTTALEVLSFAKGVQSLAKSIEEGPDDAALNAANAIIRNAPLIKTALRRLETYAHEVVEASEGLRDEAMTSFFGPAPE